MEFFLGNQFEELKPWLQEKSSHLRAKGEVSSIKPLCTLTSLNLWGLRKPQKECYPENSKVHKGKTS